MLPYQETYIQNAREIAALCDTHRFPADSFTHWYAARTDAAARLSVLRQENIALLSGKLFPQLDALHSAGAEDIRALEEFSDALMDWRTNLDCGLYVLIHDALLSLYRFRRDRSGIIRELYKLGMGLYYRNRVLDGIEGDQTLPFHFENEMVFTEAGSYLKYFEEIPDEETKGYIIRALANVAICTHEHRRRIGVTARILRIIRDDYYRSLAPGLPWDTFLRRTNQQMSANRATLSRGNLTKEELTAVLEACYEVFTPELGVRDPNIRWLWPYYEMEFNCGFVDLHTTLLRLQSLIRSQPYDQYDESGLCGNVQLPIYYGRLMKANPALCSDPRHVGFLAEAYAKMMRTILSIPLESFTEYMAYTIRLIVSSYLEIPGVPTYRAVTEQLMQRFSVELFVSSRRVGALLRAYCAEIFSHDPGFFDDIPFLADCPAGADKRAMLLDYAEDCGLYLDFGRVKMNLLRTLRTRELFEDEFRLSTLHTVCGHTDLSERPSTAIFADVALGHHSWYNGSGGYPGNYVRNESPYRLMTDVAALVLFLSEHFAADGAAVFERAEALSGRRFNPMVAAFLRSEALRAALTVLLSADEEPYYREVYQFITGRAV